MFAFGGRLSGSQASSELFSLDVGTNPNNQNVWNCNFVLKGRSNRYAHLDQHQGRSGTLSSVRMLSFNYFHIQFVVLCTVRLLSAHYLRGIPQWKYFVLTPLFLARPPSWGHSMVATEDGKLIVYGGTEEQGRALDDDYVFDPATSTWAALNAPYKPSTGRFGHSATRIGGKVYYYGGFDSDGAPLTGPRIYDIATNEWEAASPMMDDASWGLPPARGHHASVLVNDTMLLIVGGRSRPFSDKNATLFGDVYLFDTERSAWQHATCTSVAGHSAAVVGGRIFVYGGSGATAAEPLSEIPLSVASVEQIISGIAHYMHENKLSEGIQAGEGRAKSRLRVLYEQERAQRVKLQARCALLENKLFNRSSAKQLSLELLVKQLREKDIELAELKRKNEMLQRRFQSNATQEDQLREIASDLALLWQRHEEHRRQREDALASVAASEAALKKQMQKFGAILGEDFVAPLTSRLKATANNSAILTANSASKRHSHNDAAALARSHHESGEKSEEYARWLSSFNEKTAAERASKTERISESQPEMKPLDMNKLSSSGPGGALRPHSPRRAESAVSPRVRSSSSSGGAPPEIAISAPSPKDSGRTNRSSDARDSTPIPKSAASSAASEPAAPEEKKKKDKKTLSEQFLAGKATFSRRFSQVTGKAKSLLASGKEKESDKPILKSTNSASKLKKEEEEEGVWQPPSTPTSVKPLPLNMDILEKCLAYLQPRSWLRILFSFFLPDPLPCRYRTRRYFPSEWSRTSSPWSLCQVRRRGYHW